MMKVFIVFLRNLIIFLIIGFSLVGSSAIRTEAKTSVQDLTRRHEFNFVNWTSRAIFDKVILKSLNIADYLSIDSQEKVIVNYLNNLRNLNEINYKIQLIYSNPFELDSENRINELDITHELLKKKDNAFKPLVEEILESQIITVLLENQLAINGLPIPPLLFEISELPNNLIVSPKDRIEQIESVSLISQFDIKDMENLEAMVDLELGLSSLVVPIGGLGTYPTMIGSSSSLPWLINAIVHEWIHNWLAFKPLGWNYGNSSELRTMNETTASIVGSEIGILVLEKYYPSDNIAIIQPENESKVEIEMIDSNENQFIFSKEMYKTRIQVDSLLSIGKITEAEAYMETRRQVFWENGYYIRKINQAYFAFFGAYAEIPGGATGTDPVGPAVRKLRDKSESLSEFLNTIASLSSFDELLVVIE
ncbi:hypothetical protein ACFLXB_06445 [Chloroflexota bacterium]